MAPEIAREEILAWLRCDDPKQLEQLWKLADREEWIGWTPQQKAQRLGLVVLNRRFLAEFAREPDSFLGLLGLGLSMGQWLSLPMVIAGVLMLRWAQRRA